MCRYSWVQKSFVRSYCLYTGSHSLLYHPIIPYSGFQFAHKLKLKGVNADYRFNPLSQYWEARIHDHPSCDSSKVVRGTAIQCDGVHCRRNNPTNENDCTESERKELGWVSQPLV